MAKKYAFEIKFFATKTLCRCGVSGGGGGYGGREPPKTRQASGTGESFYGNAPKEEENRR